MPAAAGLVVRAAGPADAPALAALNRQARAAAMPWLREPRTEAEVAWWLAKVLIPRQQVRLAGAAAEPVGYIGFGGTPLSVFDLYAAPGRRRQGIGRRLLEEALEAAGDGPLRLHCFTRNHAARAFYEAHGFRATVFSDGTTNEEAEPDILFVRPAPPNQRTPGASA
jgi:GNAT superfamily N-acetyltransferase